MSTKKELTMQNKKGFTVAETLTTLMIIGIIAALTIPILSFGVEKQKKITMFKKLYSSFNVNIQTVLGEKNCTSMSCTRFYGSANPHEIHILADPTYFNVDFICKDCFAEGDVLPNMEAPTFNAEGEITNRGNGENFTAYILRNSAVMGLYDFADNCSTPLNNVTEQTNDNVTTHPELCGIVIFDLNGEKGPNQPGHDRFAFYISDEPVDGSYLIPIGYSADDNNAANHTQFNKQGQVMSAIGNGSCTPGTLEGYNCTAKVLTSGWKMDF